MNAKWIEHMVDYRKTTHSNETIKIILKEKVFRQMNLIKKYDKSFIIPTIEITGKTIPQILLCEARYAKIYWREYKKLLPKWITWSGRKPHNPDSVNKLLDIGYHTLVTIVSKKFEKLDIPTELGLFHHAQSKTAHPLVYDLMECYRVILVDTILIKFLHMKKEPILVIDSKNIKYFLHDIYETLNNQYYHRYRKSCISLDYWIDLILLEFRSSVSENRNFKPYFTPTRNENRCNKKSPNMEK